MNESQEKILPLLGDLSEVPQEYIRDVAYTKRVLESWTMDPAFRDAFETDAAAAIASLGISFRPDQVTPFLASPDRPGHVSGPVDPGEYPLSVLRYRAFVQEKLNHRRIVREEGESSNPRMAAWRTRQSNRCRGELGGHRQEAIVHAPAAFELSKGCTVGCWFCGVAAPKFDHNWRYTSEHTELWRGTLVTLRDVIGDCLRHGFLYWATDPLDNPDYERFMTDFHAVVGRCPQTTTAQGQKDTERTRRLLELSHSLGSTVDRFSIIALNSLHRIHAAFTPEELLRVECIPQNKEAGPKYRKSNAGRARKFAHKKGAELTGPEESATIACVSGFLFNMIDQSVQLVTPCNSGDRWPLGYWVIDRGTFGSPAELRELIDHMISVNMRAALSLSDTVRLNPAFRVRTDGADLRVETQGPAVVFAGQPDVADLAALVAEGTSTVEEIALRRERTGGVALAETLSLLDYMFAQGLLDEEPPVPAVAPASRTALVIESAR